MQSIRKYLDFGEPPSAMHKKRSWWGLFLLTVLSTVFYVFMEWMFFVTKPSFLDVMTTWKKIDVLFTSSFILILLWLPVFILLWGVSYLPGISRKWYLLLYIAGLLPAAILSITTLLLVDNFTYTLFKFGVVSTSGLPRLTYALLFLIVFVLWFRWVILRTKLIDRSPQKYSIFIQSALVLGIIVFSLVLILPKLGSLNNLSFDSDIGKVARYPNIILIGGDGIDAVSTSVYGYERDTTPNLRQLAKESLLAENAFSNSAKSSGSIISMLTGKLPTKTRVVYPPDILLNSDAYQHLPGILRSIGYRSVEISISHYIDAYTLNLRDGFDIVNERTIDQAGFPIFAQSSAFQELGYFLSVLVERVSDRVLHIFFVRQMSNPYQDVITSFYTVKDLARIRKVIKELDQAQQPVFMHVHMMGTHGGKFAPEQRVFSSGQTQDEPWMTDFYDDAILEFDSYIGELKSNLREMGVLENTIIIIYSDHGQNGRTDQKVPLMIRFPNGEFAGQIRNNVQNMDLPRTILDYMGLPVPAWMEGSSLLDGEPDRLRPIFSVGVSLVKADEDGTLVKDEERMRPPFYQFGYLQAVVCQNWYEISLLDYHWEQGEVAGHSAPCASDEMPDANTVRSWMIERLTLDGFDTTGLQDFYELLGSE